MPGTTHAAPIKVLAFMEATVVNGAAKTLLNFCDTVAHSNSGRPAVDVTITTFHRGAVEPGKPPNDFVAAVELRGIRAIVIPERHRFDRRLIKSLRSIAEEIQPDIIQTNNVKSHFLVKLAGLHRERPWIAFHHGYTATDLKVKLYNQLNRWSLPSADRVIAVCGPFRDQLIAAGVPRQKIRVLHNSAALVACAVDGQTDSLRRKYGLNAGSKVLVSIGRFSYEKGHADLVAALDVLRGSRPDLEWELLLVGSGPEQNNLEQAIQERGLERRIHFTGQQSDVTSYLQAADVMVLPSHSEGSPHVVLEAMAVGVPIVATRVGGIPEILTDGETAVLTRPRDPNALAEGIRRILESPGMAHTLAAKAKDALRERFSHDAYKRELLGIYEEVLGRARGASVQGNVA